MIVALPFTRDEMKQVYETNLIEYAISQGFEVQKSDRKSYRVKGYGGLFLFPRGFHHFSSNESGSIVDFCKSYQGLDFVQAVEQILGVSAYSNTIPSINSEPKGDVKLPLKSKSDENVIKYLVDNRCIDKEIVLDMIAQRKIYGAITTYNDRTYENCAFVSYDKDTPKYCALRGLGKSNFRQDVKHSDKTYGFSMAGTSNRIFCFESPIDLLSHATLCKLNGLDYTLDSRISEGCLSDKALIRFLKEKPSITNIVFCFDNDTNGKDYNKMPHNHGQIFSNKCADKFSKLGYKTQIQTPCRKDWNEDLQYIQKSVIKELMARKNIEKTKDKVVEKQQQR